MAIKANASSNGASEFKKFIGVGSFRVLGVNPNKEEMEKFLGRELSQEPVYLKDMVDTNDNNKPYKQLRVTYMIQADLKDHEGKDIKANQLLTEPFKTTITFFLDSRYNFNSDKTKVQGIDKYGRTAWMTVEQAKNHQIPVYANGPAKIDKDYRPAYRGEAELLNFIKNYLNVASIDTYNKNTNEWVTNQHPEDCEASLDNIQKYFKGDISELKEHCTLMPTNLVKLLVGVKTNNEGKQFNVVFTKATAKNGSNPFNYFKKEVDADSAYHTDTVYSDEVDGTITSIHEYSEKVQATDFSKTSVEEDPFAAANELPQNDDLPYGDDVDPFSE
jgi:hypothetical protein